MRQWLKKNLVNFLLVGIILAGVGLMAYPTVSDWWNSFHMTRVVASYASTVAKMDRKQYDEVIAKAEAYNQRLAIQGVKWQMTESEMEEYNSLLDVTGMGVMGYIDIPKIRVQLPLYHGTDEDILLIAIGHLAGTSLPIGGDSTHCMVSGHRGLPSAKLFTDIDKLAVGDTWTLNVLDRTLTYEVDQVRVVEPTDLTDLQIMDDKDYCTLITCTPYGVNTHRLLVRGHRIANAQGNARVTADALQLRPIYVAPFVAVPILLFLLIQILIPKRRR